MRVILSARKADLMKVGMEGWGESYWHFTARNLM